MKKFIFLTIFITILVQVALCQTPNTVHVRSIKTESKEEVSAGMMKGFAGLECVYTAYTVDSGNKVYVLESDDNRQPEVGKDYEVKSQTRDEMVLIIPGKWHPANVHFHIKSVSEKGN